ncbi:TonB-dependent receptor, partial [Prevotella sp. MGM2]|uniref:TonB-dependent receptor n=1 Tax=Prevotella sp. MGM2 TaxID=2033406 RepID=UPI000D0C1154
RHFEVAYSCDFTHAGMESNLASGADVRREGLLQSLSARYRTGGRLPLTLTLRGLTHLYVEKAGGQGESMLTRRMTPVANLSWQAVNAPRASLLLRASFQDLFRLPTFSEAYYYHLGSSDLRPERTRQLGGGMAFSYGNRRSDAGMLWTLSADAYANHVKDKIMSVPYNLFIWRTVNMGLVEVAGIDLSLAGRQPLIPQHRLYVAANYSLQHAADRTAPGSEGYGRQVAYTPLHSGSASAAYENPWMNLVVHATFSSERWSTNEHLSQTRLPAYVEVGIGVYRSFSLGCAAIDVRADLLNALDRQYEVVRRYPMPGRAYRFEVKVTW